ncbi:hypothetical protein BDN70DRAFT_580568 [Pholiota conissans]|uniref:Cytochrome P450 n=1 Tax=Pholiota conissans TaxID=109636 RepID=A0A9P5Z3R4_9AGAR|nr:hypothetical protein BDN70DRAFT_580568 [Pholiota conissans]
MISPSLVLWAVQRLGLALGGSVVLFCMYQTLELLYAELTSPLRNLAGPPSENIFFGNFRELFDSQDSSVVQQKWTEKYGKTIKFKGIMGITWLYTTDLKAMNHFLVNTQIYQKPPGAVYNLERLLGKGVIIVEGDMHKLQRKLLNPAFGPQQIRELTEVFVEKSIQVCLPK